MGQNVANLHFCPVPKNKCALLSRWVINGVIFCPGTERRKSGTERRKTGQKTGQKDWDRWVGTERRIFLKSDALIVRKFNVTQCGVMEKILKLFKIKVNLSDFL